MTISGVSTRNNIRLHYMHNQIILKIGVAVQKPSIEFHSKEQKLTDGKRDIRKH